jgi:hypothetical protein
MMPVYEVRSLERFLVRTRYMVEAESPAAAKHAVERGMVSYCAHEMEDDNGNYVATLSVRERPPGEYDPDEVNRGWGEEAPCD